MKKFITSFCGIVMLSVSVFAEPPNDREWNLVFEDNFDYKTPDLDREWISQNGPSGHLYCSRWRDNAVVEDGALKLLIKKEHRGGQDWTAGNIWTRKLFKYGYFECKYKYAAASGTNNSFWIMNQGWQKVDTSKSKIFEIDINEGHYPDEINTNLHNYTDRYVDSTGKKRSIVNPQSFRMSKAEPSVTISLDVPVLARKIRWSTSRKERTSINEIRVLSKIQNGYYPDFKSDITENNSLGIENFAISGKVSASSATSTGNRKKSSPEFAIDGKKSTSWSASASNERKFIEIDLGKIREIGAVQFNTGWSDKGKPMDYVSDYKVEYFSPSLNEWILMSEGDSKNEIDLSKTYHTYALDWNENELVYYFDGKPIRRIKNEFAHWESPVWLSLALLSYAGFVDDTADGKFMQVDYVKVWQEKDRECFRNRTSKEPSN